MPVQLLIDICLIAEIPLPPWALYSSGLHYPIISKFIILPHLNLLMQPKLITVCPIAMGTGNFAAAFQHFKLQHCPLMPD